MGSFEKRGLEETLLALPRPLSWSRTRTRSRSSSRYDSVRAFGASPRVGHGTAIEDQVDRGEDDQDGLIEWARDRHEREPGQPAQWAWKAPIARQELHRAERPSS